MSRRGQLITGRFCFWEMVSFITVFTLTLMIVAWGGVSPKSRPAHAFEKAASSVSIKLDDCEATRPGGVSSVNLPKDLKAEDFKKDPEGFQRRLIEAFKPEKLVKKGRIPVQGKSFDIYLPEGNEPYTVINKSGKDSHQNNSSTLVSIDANGDGKLTRDESWFANLPVRILDSMWDITSIAAEGSRLDIKPSRSPLRGVVVGRKCPPFSYKGEDGKRITQDTFKGKAFIIDIWSVT